jgi:hypothetical protein
MSTTTTEQPARTFRELRDRLEEERAHRQRRAARLQHLIDGGRLAQTETLVEQMEYAEGWWGALDFALSLVQKTEAAMAEEERNQVAALRADLYGLALELRDQARKEEQLGPWLGATADVVDRIRNRWTLPAEEFPRC